MVEEEDFDKLVWSPRVRCCVSHHQSLPLAQGDATASAAANTPLFATLYEIYLLASFFFSSETPPTSPPPPLPHALSSPRFHSLIIHADCSVISPHKKRRSQPLSPPSRRVPRTEPNWHFPHNDEYALLNKLFCCYFFQSAPICIFILNPVILFYQKGLSFWFALLRNRPRMNCRASFEVLRR